MFFSLTQHFPCMQHIIHTVHYTCTLTGFNRSLYTARRFIGNSILTTIWPLVWDWGSHSSPPWSYFLNPELRVSWRVLWQKCPASTEAQSASTSQKKISHFYGRLHVFICRENKQRCYITQHVHNERGDWNTSMTRLDTSGHVWFILAGDWLTNHAARLLLIHNHKSIPKSVGNVDKTRYGCENKDLSN